MKAHVVYAHPVPESFSSALHRTVVSTLEGRGWDVDDCDLNAEGFSPVLTCEERRNYHDESINIEPVRNYVERLQVAEALVFVFPVWNFGYPAILKGYFDRVFLPGVSFKLQDDGKLSPNLKNIRKLAAITTYGGNRMRAFLAGDPPRKSITRSVRYVMHPSCRMKYLALYDMNNNDEATLQTYLKRVASEMERF